MKNFEIHIYESVDDGTYLRLYLKIDENSLASRKSKCPAAITLSLPNLCACFVNDVQMRNVQHGSSTNKEHNYFFQETFCLTQIKCKLKY